MKKFLKAMQDVTDFVIGKPKKKKRKYKRRKKNEILLGSIVQRKVFPILGIFNGDDVGAITQYFMEIKSDRN